MTDRPVKDQWYVVIKAGAKLRGWQYAGQSSFNSVGCDLVIQDRLLYVGSCTIGSDSFPEDYFRCERTGVEGALSPGNWGSADMSYLQTIEQGDAARYQRDLQTIRDRLTACGIEVGALYPSGLEISTAQHSIMIDEEDGVWRVGLYGVEDGIVSDEAISMRTLELPEHGGTHVENHIARLLDVCDAVIEVWDGIKLPAGDDPDGGVSVCPHCGQTADEDEDGLHYCPRCDLQLDHLTEGCEDCAGENERPKCPECGMPMAPLTLGDGEPIDEWVCPIHGAPESKEAAMFIAQYAGHSYDGIAVGATEDQAREALVAEWNRQFPDNEMTAEDWQDSINVIELSAGEASIF